MKTKNNKKELEILEAYKKSTDYTLRDLYHSWSDEKQKAFDEILSDAEDKENASSVKILSGGRWCFSAGFYFTEDLKRFFKYYTKTNTIVFQVFNDGV